MSGPKSTEEIDRDRIVEREAEMLATLENKEDPVQTWGAVHQQTEQPGGDLTLGAPEAPNTSAGCRLERYYVKPCDVNHALRELRHITCHDPVHHKASSQGAAGIICKNDDFAALQARNRDLEALQQEAVECRNRMSAARQQAEEEVFRRYMKIICNEPQCPEAVLDPPGWVTDSPPPSPSNLRKSMKVKDSRAKKESHRIPGLRPSQHLALTWQGQGSPNEMEAESESQAKVWELTKLQYTQSQRVIDSSNIYKEVKKMSMGSPAELGKIPLKVATPPSTLLETSTVSSVTEVEEQWVVDSRDTSPSPQHPKLTPVPLYRKETHAGPPRNKHITPQPSLPSPKLPEFIRQFVDHDWFKELVPDLKSQHTLRPKAFAQLLLKYMEHAEAETKMQMLKALWGMHQQGALEITEQICTSLIEANEKHFVSKLMNTLVSLGSASQELVVELLTFLVHGELQDTAQYFLEVMGVKEVDHWLRPEIESWCTRLAGKPEPQVVLRKKAADWLEFWTYQYKIRNRASFQQHLSVKDLFSPVDVLNYFCSQQRERQEPQPSPRLPVQRETMLFSPQKYRSQPVYCLVERHTSKQKRQNRGVMLPPLLSRRPPTSFPPFISLPLPRVSPGHFPFAFSYSENWRDLGGTRQHYFFLERSFEDNSR